MFNKRKCGCRQNYGFQNFDPVIEPMINNCVEKDFYCEVPQE